MRLGNRLHVAASLTNTQLQHRAEVAEVDGLGQRVIEVSQRQTVHDAALWHNPGSGVIERDRFLF